MEQAIVRYHGGGRCAIICVSLARLQPRPISETLSGHKPQPQFTSKVTRTTQIQNQIGILTTSRQAVWPQQADG